MNTTKIPVPEPSDEGHTQSFGSEMRTNAPRGALIGALVGFFGGIALMILVATDALIIPSLSEASSLFIVNLMIIAAATAFGGAAGTLIGVGTPRINPNPQQGWVKRWYMFTIKKQGHKKVRHVYVPELKSPKEAKKAYHHPHHRQS